MGATEQAMEGHRREGCGGRRFPGGDKTKPELEWVKDGEDLARQRKPK